MALPSSTGINTPLQSAALFLFPGFCIFSGTNYYPAREPSIPNRTSSITLSRFVLTIHYNAIICPSLKKSAIIADLCIVLRESCLVFPAGTGKKAPMTLKSYKELDVWQKGVEIVDKIYSLTVTFPKEEQYGLTAQMCRSAVSVPSNIAEGFSRSHTPEYVQFLRIALGSLAELDTQSTIAHRRKYMDGNSADELAENMDHEARMLMSLIKSLKNRKDSQSESRTPNHKPRVTSE